MTRRLLATRRGTQPRAQLIERRARRHERAERVGGETRVEQAVVEWHRADRMRLPRLGEVPGILERPAAIGRVATAAEPEVRAGIDDAAVLVQAASHHYCIRFENTFLEPIWSRNYVDSVQITMAESFGVQGRGAFYDSVGAIRDVVQNHLLQVVSLLAMEAPSRAYPTRGATSRSRSCGRFAPSTKSVSLC